MVIISDSILHGCVHMASTYSMYVQLCQCTHLCFMNVCEEHICVRVCAYVRVCVCVCVCVCVSSHT